MPLPDSRNSDWPPYYWADYQRLIEEARAWLVGNLSKRAAQDDRAKWRSRVAAVLGGKPDPGEKVGSQRLHVPLPKQIARTSASLLFSDPFKFVYPEAHVKVEEGQSPTPEALAALEAETLLNELVEEDKWPSKLWQAAYIGSGEGGVYLLPAWFEGQQMPTLRVIHHNRAIPTFVAGQLVEVLIWTVVQTDKDGSVWRHLENHTAGRVQHALFKGKTNKLGDRLDLGASRATGQLRTDQDGFIEFGATGIDGLLPEYVPNLLPHPVTLSGDIGGADTQGIEDQLYALDSADTGWDTDVRVGKRRILVDEHMLDRADRGGGATFDLDQEVFTKLAHSPLEGVDPVKLVDFDIRAESFRDTVENRFARCCTAAGYNPESVTWAYTGQSMTATEVLSRDALSRDTTNSKRRYFSPALASTAEKFLKIYNHLNNTSVQTNRPGVKWPQVDNGDQKETAEVVNILSLAGAISIYSMVRRANPTWDEPAVLDEVKRIREDKGEAPNPDDLRLPDVET